ncbi:MAG TPA: hypothetical protein VKB86_10490 [Pyrinomonadaceae bacterium]|nr:hypothetical protein [Pyrinomonadaceae bacterium]
MNNRHLIVVSAENNSYMAWQSKLFHYSCASRLKQVPVIIVHDTSASLHPDFQEIMKLGGSVLKAESYKLSAQGDTYRPRNMPGTLLRASLRFGSQYDFIVLCDPDMIFTRAVKFPETLSADYCSYIKYDQEFVESARQSLGIQRSAIDEQKESLRCGMPYIIPTSEARQLATRWMEAIDAFKGRRWEDVMYAFGLAAVKLGLKVELTHMAQSNYWPDAILQAHVVHYCYGDATWSKRHFFREEKAQEVWQADVEAAKGSVLAEILSQIREAEKFYSDLQS